MMKHGSSSFFFYMCRNAFTHVFHSAYTSPPGEERGDMWKSDAQLIAHPIPIKTAWWPFVVRMNGGYPDLP